jgi:hypothetical protein
LPSLSLLALKVPPTAELWATILVPTRAAPELSVTCPWIVPSAEVCANPSLDDSTTIRAARNDAIRKIRKSEDRRDFFGSAGESETFCGYIEGS